MNFLYVSGFVFDLPGVQHPHKVRRTGLRSDSVQMTPGTAPRPIAAGALQWLEIPGGKLRLSEGTWLFGSCVAFTAPVDARAFKSSLALNRHSQVHALPEVFGEKCSS